MVRGSALPAFGSAHARRGLCGGELHALRLWDPGGQQAGFLSRMPSETDRGRVQPRRSTRLKFAVLYLALVQLGGAVIGYALMRNTLSPDERSSTDFWFILIFAFVSWVLYGVSMHRNWARYALL